MRILLLCLSLLCPLSNIWANANENEGFTELLREAALTESNDSQMQNKIQQAFYQSCMEGAKSKQDTLKQENTYTDVEIKQIWQQVEHKCQCISSDSQLVRSFIQLAKSSQEDKHHNLAQMQFSQSLQNVHLQCMSAK